MLSCARLVWEILWKKIKAHTPFSTRGGAVLPEAGPPAFLFVGKLNNNC